jgi:heme-degrading monooxygenase HmoA
MASELSVIKLPYSASGKDQLFAKWCRKCNRIKQKSESAARRVALSRTSSQRLQMTTQRPGTVAVIFIAQRTQEDDTGYSAAASAMDRMAASQPGYRGMDSTRGPDGLGITVSYWANDAAAKAWRDHPQHAAIREMGRGRWYSRYDLHVAEVTRSYDWFKPA